MKFNDYFNSVVCINLVERPDKKEQAQQRFDKFDIEVEWFHPVILGFAPKIISSIVDSGSGHFNKQYPNEISCAIAHYTVIKTAYERCIEKLFVFEDDVLFHRDFNKLFDKYMDAAPVNWDMLMLYSFMFKILPENIRINSRWIKSFKAWSHMAYAMNRKMMKGYLDLMDRMFMIADHASFVLEEQPGFNIYSAVPTLCIPDASLGSNIRGKEMNYAQTNTAINMGINNENYV